MGKTVFVDYTLGNSNFGYKYIPDYNELLNMNYDGLCREQEKIEAGFDFDNITDEELLEKIIIDEPRRIRYIKSPSEYLCRIAVEKNERSLNCIEFCSQYKDIIEYAIKKKPSVFSYYRGNDIEIYKLALILDIKNYIEIKNDNILKEIAIDVINAHSLLYSNHNNHMNGGLYHFIVDINKNFGSDKEFIYAFNTIVVNNIWWKSTNKKETALLIACDLKDNFPFSKDDYCELATYNPEVIKYIDPDILDERICLIALNNGFHAKTIFSYIPDRIKTEEFLIKLIKKHSWYLEFIENPSYEMAKLAVKDCYYVINYIDKLYKDIVIDVIQKDPFAIKYLSDQTPELCKIALEKNPECIRFIKDLHVIEKIKNL